MSEFVIQISRGNGATPWGFRLQGGADFRSPLVVQRVTAGSISSNSGLQAGDTILLINGMSTGPMRHTEAQQAIITAGNHLSLTIKRGADATASLTRKTENLSIDESAPVSRPYTQPQPQPVSQPAMHLAQQSARYQEPVGDTPTYSGYTNPNIQSHSFKQLQNTIAEGKDTTTVPSETAVISNQYNSPIGLYNRPVNQVSSEPKKYTPSQTWAAVHGSADIRPSTGSQPPPQASPYKPPPSNAYKPPEPTKSYNQPPPMTQAYRPPPQPSGYQPPAPRNNYSSPQSYNQPPPQSYNLPSNSYNPSPHAQNLFPRGFGSPQNNYSPKKSSPVRSTGATSEVPCGDAVATKGTSAYNKAGDSDSPPTCSKCDTEIRGPFVLALNRSWCPNHFTCAKCNSELVNMGFVELNGEIYCENDYEAFFAPKCARCRKAIVGDTVNALEKTWHPSCFVCTECGGAISSGAFHVEEGKPYCMNDWQRLFQTKCTGCSFPVEPGDKWIEALDANWHSECFTCATCKTQLEGKPFYPKNGKPFCKEHASVA